MDNARAADPAAAKALPSWVARKTRRLSEHEQAALARLIDEVGEGSFQRIISALAAKERAVKAEAITPLLRDMGRLLRQHPDWKPRRAATAVVKNPAGIEEVDRGNIQAESYIRRLTRLWKRRGAAI